MSNCDVSGKLILKVATPVPLERIFDYLPPEGCDAADLRPGSRVLVPFGRRRQVGVLLAVASDSDVAVERLKPAIAVLDPEPLLSATDLKLLHWAARYYHHPLGEVLAAAFPVALRQGRPAVLELPKAYGLTSAGRQTDLQQFSRAPKQRALLARLQAGILAEADLADCRPALKALLDKGLAERCELPPSAAVTEAEPALAANAEQQAAIASVAAALGRFSVSLLEGVTGSGKTEVYMQVIASVLAQGKQVLVLLPEISLTPQLEQRFRRRFAVAMVATHSKLTDNQRLQAWLSMQQGRAAIMLGTRSALFTPLQRPGLIILDEEHDSSFKQQEGFRFSARDVAVARAKMLDIPVLLGSATPSLESLANVGEGRYRLLHLPNRAGAAVAPSFQLLDIRNKRLQSGLSEPLLAEIRAALDNGQQVLLFLNRRGYAPVQICHGCGWVSRCRRCDANLVIHAAERLLRCHHCGAEHPLIKLCPACSTGELQALGLGTERIEQTLAELFPQRSVVRLDKDTTQRKGALEGYLEQIHDGRADIILGTQMLAKGHHFPGVTLVAILDIDSGLFSIDFHGAERLAQLIVQVAGRAGRAERPGRVILQTRQPQHPLLNTLLRQGYRAFADSALQERCLAGLPPYSYQALFRAQAGGSDAPRRFLQAVCAAIAELGAGSTQVLGPVAAPMARRAGAYRYQLLLQSPRRQDLHRLLDLVLPRIYRLPEVKKVRWSLDVDPLDLY
ncbi:primosomal protein N' [Methylomonas koyamae]|uniref:Replication restart protein PriA n=1 Tax=Methylomonas koyamae TaxID=702114 RepID=A0AA91I4S8_9GAMM|nr:primosomal protein N' [Methylomonas koyamae]OAI22961.1 primosomal protein N' [Methylomonas koyamae]